MDIDDLLKNGSIFQKFDSGHRHEELNEFETLLEHSRTTAEFFERYISERRIEFNFKNLDDNYSEKLKKRITQFIAFHDIGKLNPHAQRYYHSEEHKSDLTEHANCSFLILSLIFFSEFSNLKNKKLKYETRTQEDLYSSYLWLFMYSVAFHHTNLGKMSELIENQSSNQLAFEIPYKFLLEKYEDPLRKIIEILPKEWNLSDTLVELKEFWSKDILNIDEKYSLFFDIKLIYSILVQSDYFATYSYQFERNINEIEINIIDRSTIEIMKRNFYNIPYNKEIQYSGEYLSDISQINNLNSLRNNLLKESSSNLKLILMENKSKIFTLHVPTGGGKTNISLKLVLDILDHDKKVNRVFWSFPYVNIIEQNYEVIEKHYFADVNRKKEYVSKIFSDNFEVDAEKYIDYDKNRTELLESDLNIKYVNNPVNIISNVNFFNSFFKIKKQNRYKFANFVNSIVVIDEIQSLNEDYIDLFYNTLEIISKNYNIYFIIMSATLPNPNLFLEKNIAMPLLIKSKDYFSHQLFKRNSFIYEDTKLNADNLEEYLENKILFVHNEGNKFLLVLNTIKSSIRIFKRFSSNLNFKHLGFKILLLNSYISTEDKKKIIKYIQNSKEEKIFLISTQSIEAGVDLDFDIAFRDNAVLDSIEQIAGRVNRERKKEPKKSFVYIINYENESEVIYGKDEKFKIISEQFGSATLLNILEEKSFDVYYQKYFERIKYRKKSALKKDNLIEIGKLNFKAINELDIIEKRVSVKIVKEKIPERIKGELGEFLKQYSYVWELLSLIKMKKIDNHFKWKSYIDIISKLISNISQEISFSNHSQKEIFCNFLIEKNYLVNKENKVDNFLILSESFFEKYFIFIEINQELKYSYLDLDSLKNDIKKYDKELGGIFI